MAGTDYYEGEQKNGRIAPASRVRKVQDLASVMLGLVPSICDVAFKRDVVDPRDKPEDDVESG
jgi:hypothetical protein